MTLFKYWIYIIFFILLQEVIAAAEEELKKEEEALAEEDKAGGGDANKGDANKGDANKGGPARNEPKPMEDPGGRGDADVEEGEELMIEGGAEGEEEEEKEEIKEPPIIPEPPTSVYKKPLEVPTEYPGEGTNKNVNTILHLKTELYNLLKTIHILFIIFYIYIYKDY